MSGDDQDLYAVLGIARTATAEEIKKAYFSSVRLHPPDVDADGFRRVQAAFETLRDEKTRREYDEAQRTDPEARELFEAGRKLLQRGRATDAVSVLKRALARQPDSLVIRDVLTQALIAIDEFEEARKHAGRLLQADAENAAYCSRMGDILRSLDRDDEAVEYYQRAVQFDRDDSQHIISLASALNYVDRVDEAVKLLENAIKRDGKVDFDDFEYFQSLYSILASARRPNELARTRQRIRAILPADRDQRSYVSWFYHQNALTMATHGNFDAALGSIEEAADIDGALPEVAQTLKRFRDARPWSSELQQLEEADELMLALRMMLVTLGSIEVLGHDASLRGTYERALERLEKDMSTRSDVRTQVRDLQDRFPAVAQKFAKVLADIIEKDEEREKTSIQLSCPSCGAKSRAPKPTAVDLAALGLDKSEAHDALEARGEQGVLEMLSFRCNVCGTRFNGLSKHWTSRPAQR